MSDHRDLGRAQKRGPVVAGDPPARVSGDSTAGRVSFTDPPNVSHRHTTALIWNLYMSLYRTQANLW
jgi:hypothetical protein